MSGQSKRDEPQHEVSQSHIDRQTQSQIRTLPASLARLMNESSTPSQTEDVIPPISSSAGSGSARNTDIDRRRGFTSSRQDVPSPGDPVSPSISATSEDIEFDRNVSAMDPRSYNPTITSCSDLRDPSYPQRHQSQRSLSSTTQGTHTNIPSRPRSAADNAYLSDLSTASVTSSARGAPPPSQASVRTSTSLSSESSSARITSWQREQSEEFPTSLVGPGVGLRRDDISNQYAPSQQEVEYEMRSGRRTHFPVSTMRGGSAGSRSYQYPYTSTTPGYSSRQGRFGAIEDREASWSGSEPDYDSEVSAPQGRGRGRTHHGSLSYRGEISSSEVISTSTSPLPSERSTSAHSSIRDVSYASSSSSIQPGQRYGYRYSDQPTQSSSHTLTERFVDPARQMAGSGLSPVRTSESPTGTASHYYSSGEAHLHSTSARRIARLPGSSQTYTSTADDPYAPPRRGSPYTSLSRYATYGYSVHRPEFVDEFPHMRRSLHNSPTSPPPISPIDQQPQRSFTYPTDREERIPIHERISNSEYSTLGENQSHRSGYGTSMSAQDTMAGSSGWTQRRTQLEPAYIPARYPSHPSQHQHLVEITDNPRIITQLPSDSHIEDVGKSSVLPVTEDDRRTINTAGNLSVQYPYPPEAPTFSSISVQVVQVDTPSSSKRAKTLSTDAPQTEEDVTANKGKRKGSTRGRGRGKKVLGPPTTTVPAVRPAQLPSESPVYWGREQRITNKVDYPRPGSSTSLEQTDSAGQNITSGPSRPRNVAKKVSKSDLGRNLEEHQENENGSPEPPSHLHPSFVLGPASTEFPELRRTPRIKVDVACYHCRRRKMKCDGQRPSCSNCLRHVYECGYMSHVRRRGPGKNKKKGQTNESPRPKKTNKSIEGGEKKTRGRGKNKNTHSAKEKEDDSSDQQGEHMVRRMSSVSLTTSMPLGVPDTSFSFTPMPDSLSSLPLSSIPLTLPSEVTEASGQHAFSFGPSGPAVLDTPESGASGEHVSTRSPSTEDVNITANSSASVSDETVRVETSGSGTARFASTLSSGQSSSEGEHGQQPGRRRAAKRQKTDKEEDGGDDNSREAGPPDDGSGGREV